MAVTSSSRATMLDAQEMAPNMRKADADEVWASGRRTPLEALVRSIQLSGDRAWTVRVDGEIMCIWGVAPVSLLAGMYSPWALTTSLVEKRAKRFYRMSKLAAEWLGSQDKIMFNVVDARHTQALRWARRIGFEVEPAIAYGREGELFHPIVMKGGRHV